ncbi:MAG: 5'-3' exonuclease H3TH domain-containing protein [Thiolinea sp.]
MSQHLFSGSAQQRIWLVDASIYIFRAWFVKGRIPYDHHHKPVNAVHGFLRFLYAFLHDQQPQQLAFAFDTSLESSARKDIYPLYKANRQTAPEELKYQFQLCRDFLDALGIVQQASTRHEADDLIGAWACQQRRLQNDAQIIILSGDKDLAQLLENDDLWWDYGRRKPLNDGGVKSSFGVWPQQIADQLAIAGDKADNIPGVPGVGMATAAKLLRRFGDIDNLFANLHLVGNMQIHGAKRLQQLLTEHQDTVRLARQLTGIEYSIAGLPQALQRRAPDQQRLQELCELLNLPEQQMTQWQAF